MNRKACSRCSQESASNVAFTFVSSESPSSAELICSRCAIEQHANKLQTVEEADRCIAETMEEIEAVERLLAKFPQMPAVPEGLQGIALTPLSIHKTYQHYLAAFKSRRLELIQEMGSEARLRYELGKAIEAEEYERAAEIKRQLNEE